MTAPTAKRIDAYDAVTNRIIELLEKGVVPWRQPWTHSQSWPRNLVSRKPYRGINTLILACSGYPSPYWVTFRQALLLGGHVKKGEKGFPGLFWKVLERGGKSDAGDAQIERIPVLRYFTVFNAVGQCEGLEDKVPAEPKARQFQAVEAAARILDAMPRPPEISYGGDQACYCPAQDRVHIPPPERFDPAEQFYSTLWHELIHSTGHKDRLGRPGVVDVRGFGSHEYSREELVAEIGAAFLCSQAGIANATLENSAAYINGWLARLKEDKRLIVTAAAQAQKAADYILGHRPMASENKTEVSGNVQV